MNETTNRPGGSHAAVDKTMMERCIRLSAKGIEQGEMPFAGLIARGGDVLVETPNQVAATGDSRTQEPVGLHPLFDGRALSDVRVCGKGDTHRARRVRHPVARDGR